MFRFSGETIAPICIYCFMEQPFTEEKKYPICNNCSGKPTVHMSTGVTY